MTIALDTPEQINAWVLLSRVSQASLHLKGYKVPGLYTWLKNNVPGDFCRGTERTVKEFVIPLLDWCDDLGISTDRVASLIEGINFQVVATQNIGGNLFIDQGVYASMDDAKVDWMNAYLEGRVHLFRTWEPVRGARSSLMYSL